MTKAKRLRARTLSATELAAITGGEDNPPPPKQHYTVELINANIASISSRML